MVALIKHTFTAMNQWYPWSFSQNSEDENEQNNKNTQNQGQVGMVSNTPPTQAVSGDFDEVDALLAGQEVSLEAPVSETEVASETTTDTPVNVTANPRLTLLRHALEEVRDTINKALDILNDEMGVSGSMSVGDMRDLARVLNPAYTATPIMPVTATQESSDGGRVVEGIFDGQSMVGPDGKQYSVPANYASKSKLVEGDVMKLTIAPQGTFVYKQIGPIDRKRVIATLEQNSDTHDFYAVSGEQRWRILTASVTYFKGMSGDEVVVLVPQNSPCKWAAVENIIKKV